MHKILVGTLGLGLSAALMLPATSALATPAGPQTGSGAQEPALSETSLRVATMATSLTADSPDGLYSQLLGRLLPHPIRPVEQLSDALDRMGRIRGLNREIAALEKKLRTEPQLNRKLELRKQIKDRTAVLTELTAPVASIKE